MGAHFRRSRRDSRALTPDNPLEGLLEEMHELRLTLAADLTAAAGAADAGADTVARDIIDADQRELARFARVANIRLERLSGARPEPIESVSSRRTRTDRAAAWRRRVAVAVPAVPVVGAMALSAAAATGVLPLPSHPAHAAPRPAVVRTEATGPVSSTFRQLEDVLDGNPSASQVIAVASKLHKQLRQLIATSPDNPHQVAAIAELLRMEQSLLMRAQPPGASVVLDATRKLARKLVNAVPSLSTPSAAPTLVPTTTPSSHHAAHHHSAPAPAPSTSPSKNGGNSTQPSSKPSSSPSPSQSPFPAIPNN